MPRMLYCDSSGNGGVVYACVLCYHSAVGGGDDEYIMGNIGCTLSAGLVRAVPWA